MKALVWKELRENFKWALLAMLVLAGAEYYALTYQEYGYPDYYHNDGITLCRKVFLTATTFGCIAVGLLLGLIQILPELKRDQWASLLHRPVSRGVLFAGKAVAGLLLYLAATGLPFLFLVWLVATPGNFPSPFVLEMVKPGVADILGGAVFYCAALALSLPRGWSWWRALPLLAAVGNTYFIQDSPLFYVAVEASLLMAFALLVAAWGTIHNQDLFRPRPWLGKFAFVAVAFWGVCGLGDLLKTFSQTFLKPPASTYQRYVLSTDGVPLLISYKSNVVVSVNDLEGKTPSDPKYQPDRVRNHINYLSDFSNYIGDRHGWKSFRYTRNYRESTGYIGFNSPYLYPRQEQWFHLVRENSYVGFLPSENKAFARLDANGFQPVDSIPQPFGEEVKICNVNQDSWLIAGWKGLRLVQLAKREIVDSPVPEPGPIYGIGSAYARTETGAFNVVGVVFEKGMGIYDNKGKLLTTMSYHHDMDRWGSVGLAVKAGGDRYYLSYRPSVWIDQKTRKSMPSYLETVDAGGRVVESYTLPPLADPVGSPSLDYQVARVLKTPFFFFGTMLYQKIGGALGSERLQKALNGQLNSGWKTTRETALWLSSLSVVLAAGTFWWARRRHFTVGEAAGWTLFVLLFNLAGLIAFRLSADWPTLVRCPRCPGSRPVEWENCPSCGQNWPHPEKNGSEIVDRPVSEFQAEPV